MGVKAVKWIPLSIKCILDILYIDISSMIKLKTRHKRAKYKILKTPEVRQATKSPLLFGHMNPIMTFRSKPYFCF